MDLEINIKVPLGAGVSVTQNAEPVSQLVPVETPALATALPPSLEELGLAHLGLAQASRAETETDIAPPSLSELGLDEAAEPAGEAEPPPIEALAGLAAAGAEEAMLPPSLEELGLQDAPATEDLAPPSLEALGMVATVAEPTTGNPQPAGGAGRKGATRSKSAARKA